MRSRIPPPPTWAAQAACRGSTALFFPEPGASEVVAAAKAVSRECPVREPCLEAALAGHEGHGAWGRLTVTERYGLRRLRGRNAA